LAELGLNIKSTYVYHLNINDKGISKFRRIESTAATMNNGIAYVNKPKL